jgi:hypothetical protein
VSSAVLVINRTLRQFAFTFALFGLGIILIRTNTELKATDSSPQFEKNVLPILGKYCLFCHGAAMQMGDLDLRAPALMIKGGTQGQALVKGSAEKTLMFQRIANKSMPPVEKKVTEDEARIIRDWINAGALTMATEDRSSSGHNEKSHWAFRPPVCPPVPTVKTLGWVNTPLDAFVLAQLEKKNIKAPTVADRRTLLRRVYLDVIGFPPTPEEQSAFLSDKSPNAYARVVESLLSRPQYGERWARYWLDVVRYAESNGYERDGAKPHAWRYRDYVINAIN